MKYNNFTPYWRSDSWVVHQYMLLVTLPGLLHLSQIRVLSCLWLRSSRIGTSAHPGPQFQSQQTSVCDGTSTHLRSPTVLRCHVVTNVLPEISFIHVTTCTSFRKGTGSVSVKNLLSKWVWRGCVIISVVCRSGKNHICVDPVSVTSIRLMREDGIVNLGFMVLL